MALTAKVPLLAAVLWTSLACSIDLSIPDKALIRCSTSAECPQDWSCSAKLERCIPPGGDEEPPSVLADSLVLSRTRVGRATPLTITFQVSEALGVDPSVTLEWSGAALTRSAQLSSRDEQTYDYSYTPVVGDLPGDVSLNIEITDLSGNPGAGIFPRALAFDFESPEVVTTSVASQLIPEDSNVLSQVDAVTIGTRVRLFFALTESTTGLPEVEARLGNDVLPLVNIDAIGTVFTYELDYLGGIPDGVYTIHIEASDLADNRLDENLQAELPTGLQTVTITIDTRAPDDPGVQTPDLIVYTRIPWGSQGDGPSFVVTGQPTAVEGDATVIFSNSADLSAANELARAAAAFDGSFGPVGMGAADRIDIYLTAVDNAGNPSNAVCVQDAIWIATLAGKVANRTLENPHDLLPRVVPDADRALQQTGSLPTSELSKLAVADGTMSSQESEAEWRLRAPFRPTQGNYPATSYDPLADELLYAVRDPVSSVEQLSLWASEDWRTLPWATPAPPPFLLSTMVFNPDLKLSVLVGGFTMPFEPIAGTWLWDGIAWQRPDASGDITSLVSDAAVVWDGAHDQLVLFGGLLYVGPSVSTCPNGDPPLVPFDACASSETWLQIGSTWSRAAPASSPSERLRTALAYDPVRQRVVLFGGCDGTADPCVRLDDTWEWDGFGWVEMSPIGPLPPARGSHQMAFDPSSGAVLMFGGETVDCEGGGPGFCNDAYQWLGDRWEVVSQGAVRPGGRVARGMFAAPGRGSVLLVMDGPPSAPGSPELWEWNGAWRLLSASGATPHARIGAAAAYDEARDRMVVFSGKRIGSCGGPCLCDGGSDTSCETTWEWDGSIWQRRCTAVPAEPDFCPTQPQARTGSAMVYDSQRRESILFGGGVSAGTCEGSGETTCPSTHTWDGNTWTRICGPATACPGGPAPRTNHAMVYDSVGDRVLLFGGEIVSGARLDDTWELGPWPTCANFPDRCWRQVATNTPPSARAGHAMIYDPRRNVTLVFGGQSDQPCDGLSVEVNSKCWRYDTWQLSGSTWTLVSPTAASPDHPGGRLKPTWVLDRDRNRGVLFGGFFEAASIDDETWEWTGTRWLQRQPSGRKPLARFFGTMTYDTNRRRTVLFGGGLTVPEDVSELVNDAERKPAALLAIDWLASGVPSTAPILKIELEVSGVGTGYSTDLDPADGATEGTPLYGLELRIWNEEAQRWEAHEPFAAPDASVTTGVLAIDQALAAGSLSAAEQRYYFEIAPLVGAGNGVPLPRLEIDYLEARIRYRLSD